MEQKLIHSRTQYPVGQGFFHLGSAVYTDGPVRAQIRYIYDCGASGSQRALLAAIKEVADDRVPIDFLFISHLDHDHISGLPALLASVEIKRIVLPLFTDSDKVVAGIWALQSNLNGMGGMVNEFVRRFIDDPAVAIRELPDSLNPSVDIIELDPEPNDEPAVFTWNDNDWDVGSVEPTQTSVYEFVVQNFAARSKPPVSVKIWEIVTYVDPWVLDEQSTFLDALNVEMNMLQFDNRSDWDLRLDSDRQKFLSIALSINSGQSPLKRIMKQAVRRARLQLGTLGTAKDRRRFNLNATSLVVYSGPTDKLDEKWKYNLSLHQSGGRASRSMYYGRKQAIGWMGLGDGDFSGRWDGSGLERLLERFKDYLDRVECLSVPHHGSRFDHSKELYEAFEPTHAVAACGSKNGYGHPARVVHQDLSILGIRFQVVTEMPLSRFEQRFEIAHS